MTKKEFHDLLGDLEAQLKEADEEMFGDKDSDDVWERWENDFTDYIDAIYRNISKARICLRKEMKG